MPSLGRSSRVHRLGLIGVAVLAFVAAVTAGRLVLAGATPPAGDARPVAAFLGDGFTQGLGASDAEHRWTRLVADSRGWREANFGRSGTGYVTTAPPNSCGQQICPPYDQLIDQVAALAPAVVVVSGGASDWYGLEFARAATTDSIRDFYTALRNRLPQSQIIVVGPVQPPDAAHEADVRAIGEVVGATAAAGGFRFVDLMRPAPVLDGPGLVAPDGFNATDDGHAAIAARVLAGLG